MENLSIDSTSIRVNESANGGEKSEIKAADRSRGGLTTKIHAIVDGLGNPVVFLLFPGNEHDFTHAVEVLKKLKLRATMFWATELMIHRKSGSILQAMGSVTPFHQEAMPPIPGRSIGSSTRNATWLNVSSRKSSDSVESLPDTTNLMPLSSPLFISPLLSFGYFKRLLFIFQTRLKIINLFKNLPVWIVGTM